MRQIIVVVNDIRSCHNVGSLLRTADGFGVQHVYFTGLSPYPKTDDDKRLPHISRKLTSQIEKTALGAINTVSWSSHDNLEQLLDDLRLQDYKILGLEQGAASTYLNDYNPPNKCALILGNEVKGLAAHLQELCDDILEIKMYGQKESFNVAQATAIALYALRES